MTEISNREPRKSASWRSFAVWAGMGFALLVLDQIVKVWIQTHFYEGEFLPVASFFNLCHVRNTGAAFSFLADAGGWQRVFFAGLAAVVSVLALAGMKLVARPVVQCAAALVFSGAVGNAIDRVVLGSVVDFIYLHVGLLHWPAINNSHNANCCGAALLFWAEWRRK